jgi:hypothetical protein
VQRLIPALAVLVACPAAALAQQRPEKAPGVRTDVPPALAIEAPHGAFPDAFQHSTVRRTFRFTNQGAREVVIEEAFGLKPGATVTARPTRVPPGAQGTIEVAQDVGDVLGETSFRFALITDEPGVSRYRLSLSGFVMSAYAPEIALVDFGRVTRGAAVEKTLEIASREVERLEVLRAEDVPGFLDVDTKERAGLAGENVVVRVRLSERPPLGLSTGRVVLWTNAPTQPRLELRYAAQVFADVEPEAHPLSFQLVRMGEPRTIDVRLRSRSGRAFQVKEAVDTLGVVDVTSEPCGGGTGPSPCVVLHATAHVLGPLDLAGSLLVKIEGDAEVLPLAYSGMVINPQTRVQDLDASTLPSPARVGDAAPPGPSAAAAPSPPPAGPPPRGLSWRARNDEELYGYVVYRADKEIGPFRRVSEVIRVDTAPGVDHRYAFDDPTAVPGRTYYYYLDTISRRGTTERFSPVRSRVTPPAGR